MALQATGDARNRFYIPAMSGCDFNKVIERAHARLEAHIIPWFKWRGSNVTVAEAKAECERAFYHVVNSSTVITRDVLTLKKTYAAIIEAQGGHFPKEDR